MNLRSSLPLDRWKSGVLVVEDNSKIVLGPFLCLGKADNAMAASHSNPSRINTLPFGDHPFGTYVIVGIQKDKQPTHSYGPYFLLLEPFSGDALVAKYNGRVGLAIHGGDLNANGSLRATEGCLRTTNDAVTQIVSRIKIGDYYICELG